MRKFEQTSNNISQSFFLYLLNSGGMEKREKCTNISTHPFFEIYIPYHAVLLYWLAWLVGYWDLINFEKLEVESFSQNYRVETSIRLHLGILKTADRPLDLEVF